jgi:hypothetical protein
MHRLLTAAAALGLLALGAPDAHAQLRSYAAPGTARVIERASCDSAALARDPAGELKLALGAHRRFAAGMSGKFRRGVFLPPSRPLPGAPDLETVRQRVAALGDNTAVLIYAGDPVNRRRCIWIVDARGLVAHGSGLTDEFGRLSPMEDDRELSGEGGILPSSHASGRALRSYLDGSSVNLAKWQRGIGESGWNLLPEAYGLSSARRDFPTYSFTWRRSRYEVGITSRLVDVSHFDRLLILPTGGLSDFPFAALPINGKPLGLTTAIVQLTDVNDLLDGRTFRFTPPDAQRPALIVGDPVYAAHPAFGTPAQLEYAAREAGYVARQMAPATMLTAGEATPDAFLARVNQTTFIHLATHGLADGVNPQDGSVIALAGGYVSARRIAQLNLTQTKPLVVMSACQTGLGKNFPTGVFGLARSWLYAGAGQVVMSQWDVNDASTMRLMSAFAAALRSDPRPEYALRAAYRAVADIPDFRDPYYWAGFTVFGPPSAR